MNEGISPKSPILRQTLVVMATSLEGSQSDIAGFKIFYTPEVLVKIAPLDSEIPGLESRSLN